MAATSDQAARSAPKPRIRLVECRSILNKSGLADYAINCYTGCAHACVYCYACFMKRFTGHTERWGTFVDVKVNAVEVLKRQVRRRRGATVFMSSVCDGWQPLEEEYRLSRRCVEVLLDNDCTVSMQTKSALIERDFDVLSGQDNVELGMTLTSLDDDIAAVFEPGASPPSRRLAVLHRARKLGIPVYVFLGPLLPFVTDTRHYIERLLEAVAPLEPTRIYVDRLNPYPMVWLAVKRTLRRWRPDLIVPCENIFLSATALACYEDELRGRVVGAARDLHVDGVIQICF